VSRIAVSLAALRFKLQVQRRHAASTSTSAAPLLFYEPLQLYRRRRQWDRAR
jgi:hypothetical protein